MCSLVAFALCSSTDVRLAAQVNPRSGFWIAIGVAQPVYRLADVAKLQVSFVVVNDGDAAADPGIGSSQLFINDIEPRDWRIVINNGIRSPSFTALPPGEVLSFSYQLGPRYFTKPGVYRVRWKAGSVQSPEITFRVLPDKR
jgi:hypothetical protein